jgi:hypothetical protein
MRYLSYSRKNANPVYLSSPTLSNRFNSISFASYFGYNFAHSTNNSFVPPAPFNINVR